MKKKLSSIISMILAVTMILSNIIVVHADTVNESLLKEDRFTDIEQVLIGSGGYITGLVIHPDDPDIMYIRTDVGGAYRWEAETESWTQIMSSFQKDGQYAVDGIAIDPNNKDIVYVCVGNDQPWLFDSNADKTQRTSGIWKSTDRGNTWTDISPTYSLRFSGNSEHRGDGECIAVDPNNSNIIWVGSRSLESYRDESYKAGLHYTTDGGKTWNKKMLYGPYGTKEEVRCVFYDPSSVKDGKSQTIYAVANIMDNGVNVGGLYRSTDAGANWAKIPAEGLAEVESYSASWDVSTEFYNQMKADAEAGKTPQDEYVAGPFKFTMSSWYGYDLSTPVLSGSAYQTTITDSDYGATGYFKADSSKLIINKPITTSRPSTSQSTTAYITFTAPVTGRYSFVPQNVSGSNWVTTSYKMSGGSIQLYLTKNGETVKQTGFGSFMSTTVSTSSYTDVLTNVRLEAGETIVVSVGSDAGKVSRDINIDFRIDLIESGTTVLPAANYYHEAKLDSEGRVLMTFGEKRTANTTEAAVRGLYRLNTDGAWQNFGVNLPSDGFTTYMSLEVDETNPDRVAVGVGTGIVTGSGETSWKPPIYYTTDGGKSWVDVTPINSDKMASEWKGSTHSSGCVASLVFGEGDEMWMTDWTEVYYTPTVSGADDAARNWSTKIKNIEELVTFSMISPKNGDNLFTAADTQSAFVIGDDEVDVYPSIQASSSDRGLFQQGDYSAGNPKFIVGAHSSQNSSEGGYVYISENGGDTWTIASGVNKSLAIYPGDAAVSATDTNKLVITTLALGDGSKVLYSADKGATWQEATGSPTDIMPNNVWHGSSPLESDKNKGNIFYVLASDGFYRSEDYGATWKCTSTVPKLQQNSDGSYVKNALNVITYENCPGEVWVSSAAGVWYSEDYGDNFVQIEGLTNGSIALGKGKTDGSYVLYFNGILEDNDKAIYYSEDKGESFVRITDYNKYSLAKEGKLGASRNTYGRVYIGTSGLGWKYLDAPLHSWNENSGYDEINHWTVCDTCGAIKDTSAHEYDNSCDTTCDTCGYVRTITHSWSKTYSSNANGHWFTCSICGENNLSEGHAFDNTCDEKCDICGYERATEHAWNDTWTSDGENHWHACSVCGEIKDQSAHEFDNDSDNECNICEYKRPIETYNIGDEMVAGVEAYFEANGSTDMSGSPLFNGAANIPYFGAFKYTAQVY
ncbi:MAG: hypothetical protein J6K88_04900, partial [Oscillospiraceae bacterium]|nr:hypothetical protein [Oscillospiraceae bacterium]